MQILLALFLMPILLFSGEWEPDDQTISFLEEKIPEMAEVALKLAYWKALSSGSCVLITRNGFLIEVCPDGSETIIKEMPPWIPVSQRTFQINIKIENEG